MNKTELVAAIAEKTGLSKADTTVTVDALFSTIQDELASGEEGAVRIIGFGSFQVSNRKASTRRNPSTGKTMEVPACKVPKFKAGKSLKEAVNS